MQRDMDMVRDIMLEIETGKKVFEVRSDDTSRILMVEELGMSREEADKLEHHLKLIQNRGLAEFTRTGGGGWIVDEITWAGHDFLDSVRDSEIWAQTKVGAEKAGGFTFDIIVAVAKGLIRTKLEKHTGVQIDL
ncbi:DUF2513 domain-containing protein [Roseibium sp.]|uniref:DUF2513 domain-containing protein n=1 Tax=Roseibium sp. TaxID=1936156 RepID=UPI003D0DE3C1